MAWNVELETAFHPNVVAVVGVASDARREAPSVLGGAAFIRAYEQLNFPGSIYIVNPGTTEILGYQAYPSVSSIPARPDLVIIAVPARFVPDILEDCIAANVKNIHILTAGFEETGEEEAKEETPNPQSSFPLVKPWLPMLSPRLQYSLAPAQKVNSLALPMSICPFSSWISVSI